MTESSLEHIFDDTGQAVTESEPVKPPVDGTQEHKDEAKTEPDVKVADAETTSAEKPDEDESWTKPAMLDERRKRQEAESKIKELEEKLAQNTAPPEKVQRPDALEDPDGAITHLEQDVDLKIRKVQVDMAEKFMRRQHEDYDEVKTVFLKVWEDHPTIGSLMRPGEDQAEFAYRIGKTHMEMQKLADPDARAKMKEELRKELEAESGKKSAHTKGVESAMQASRLTDATAQGSNNEPVKADDKNRLDSIFADRKY